MDKEIMADMLLVEFADRLKDAVVCAEDLSVETMFGLIDSILDRMCRGGHEE